MFRIAICDDEPRIGSEIENILAEYQREYQVELETEVFHSGEELCTALEDGEIFHLLYLDVRMKLLDGIEVSRKIREEYQDESTQIVYVSSDQGYTLQMFENRPLNFILKPVSKERIFATLNKALALMKRDGTFFEYRVGNRQCRIHCGEILFFASDNKKIQIFTTTGNSTFYGKLSLLERQLQGNDFVMIHKSYLVNYLHIREALYDAVQMSDGTLLPISQPFRKPVRDFMVQRRKGERDV